MGVFDAGRRRQEHLDAQGVLSDLRRTRRSWSSVRYDWNSAQTMLREHFTQDEARTDSYKCRRRIEYLEVSEPQPVIEDFAPETLPPLQDCPAKLAELQARYQRELKRHAERQKSRVHELATLKALYPEIQAAEVAKKREWQKSCWPKGVVLDRETYEMPDVETQVQHQNAKLESRVNALNDLPHEGLQQPSDRIDPHVIDSYRGGDASGIAAYIEAVLTAMPLPDFIQSKAKVAYTPDSRQLIVEYELPTVEIVPRAKLYRFVKSRETVTETTRPVSQVKGLYANAIAQITLICLAAIFDADGSRHIDVVVLNGVVDTLDPRSGQPIRPCLITVRVTRDTFAGLNLNQVDPQACLKYVSASVSKSPTELIPVRPVLEFSMVDPRFIAETDAIGSMDSRPNLLEMKPTDFESLIQNLFTKMGLEARQTRPSRDGGVDCVAYDTRPIFGGKVVIQAKRYKNTVGVSAVRDLFGTLQNEGASKGILVTTSGYGPASFEFAQNKPIELIDGGNLLYLLETYAGVTARIEPPDDWKDPVPDSGEPWLGSNAGQPSQDSETVANEPTTERG
jgi:HJR/Mrr/RecB family endonuclease